MSLDRLTAKGKTYAERASIFFLVSASGEKLTKVSDVVEHISRFLLWLHSNTLWQLAI